MSNFDIPGRIDASMSRFFQLDNFNMGRLALVKRTPIEDNRGSLGRLFCDQEFKKFGITKPIKQINHSMTKQQGSVRGMHFQYPPYAETKIVSCVKGRVFDVAVDIRQGSSSFLQWHGNELSAENKMSFIIPEGFAHGFQTLCDDVELLYLHTESFAPHAQGVLNPLDEKIAIQWPINMTEISLRDKQAPFVDKNYKGLDLDAM